MPKKVIQHSVSPNHDVTVGWTKDQDVQLGIGVANWFRFVNRKGVPLEGEEEELYNSLWFTFSHRGEINQLIVALRRARDSAFGKDA